MQRGRSGGQGIWMCVQRDRGGGLHARDARCRGCVRSERLAAATGQQGARAAPTSTRALLHFAPPSGPAAPQEDAKVAAEAHGICDGLSRELEKWETQRLLGGPYDDRVREDKLSGGWLN